MTTRDFLLAAHHRDIEEACLALLSDTYADDPRNLCASWRRFEASVEAHFSVEEKQLFPTFETIAPEETQILRAEHARIRRRMAQVGIDVDLHAIRARQVHDLIDALHRHAFREDAYLYRWAAATLDPAQLERVRDGIEAHPLLAPEGVDGVHPRGLARREEAEHDADRAREAER